MHASGTEDWLSLRERTALLATLPDRSRSWRATLAIAAGDLLAQEVIAARSWTRFDVALAIDPTLLADVVSVMTSPTFRRLLIGWWYAEAHDLLKCDRRLRLYRQVEEMLASLPLPLAARDQIAAAYNADGLVRIARRFVWGHELLEEPEIVDAADPMYELGRRLVAVVAVHLGDFASQPDLEAEFVRRMTNLVAEFDQHAATRFRSIDEPATPALTGPSQSS